MYKRGFSVIEVLVVLGIIGLILALMLAAFGTSRSTARDNLRLAGVNNIILAIEQYRAVCRNYPAQLDLVNPQYCSARPEDFSLANFLPALPKLPSNNDQFYYATFATVDGDPKCTHFHLGVKLERNKAEQLSVDTDRIRHLSPLCRLSEIDFDGTDEEGNWMYDIYK